MFCMSGANMTVPLAFLMTRVQVCVLAFLAVLGAGEASTRALKDCEARGSGPLEWGPEQNGVRTGLVTLDIEFSLGKPRSIGSR